MKTLNESRGRDRWLGVRSAATEAYPSERRGGEHCAALQCAYAAIRSALAEAIGVQQRPKFIGTIGGKGASTTQQSPKAAQQVFRCALKGSLAGNELNVDD